MSLIPFLGSKETSLVAKNEKFKVSGLLLGLRTPS
jgi:hypothetical protein